MNQQLKLTGNPSLDVNVLRKQTKQTLLTLCQSSNYVLNLCNDDIELNRIIRAPDV